MLSVTKQVVEQKDKEERRLSKVKISIMRNPQFAFWSGVMTLGRTRVVEDLPTAATNGRDEAYGREFIKELDDKELAFVVLHETMHKVYRHLFIWRKLYDEDARLANMACDYVINLELVDMDKSNSVIAMPVKNGKPLGLLDEQFRGMNSKQVFDILKQEQKDGKCRGEGGAGDGKGEGGGGFDELWELDTKTWKWRAAGSFGRGRIYCATAAFDGKIWIVGGDVIESNGTRHAVTTVQIYDPRTGTMTNGVPNTIARPMPMALAAGDRLYVVGNAKDHYEEPGQMESIGVGESKWRREPDGPPGMGPLAGATLDGKLYIAVKDRGLAIFDTQASRWEPVDGTYKPRSSQMTAYQGEIWMMGGRDTAGEDQTLIYSPKTKTWRKGLQMPRPLSWGAAEVVNGRLIVTGGAASYGRDYLYNDLTFVLRK